MFQIKNIYKDYFQGKEAVPVLHNITLSVSEGEYVAIMGPSGSGKSTLMNIIGCLDKQSRGTFDFDGTDIMSASDKKLSEIRNKKIGFVFQNFNLLPRQSALENVELPLLYAGVSKKERRRRAKEALRKVGLENRMMFKPTQLSGGQKQRVAIARAIVNGPKLLLADEPTGALDTASGEQVMDLFEALNDEGVTIVMITHEPDIAKRAKRILFIRDGELFDEPMRFERQGDNV
ncbi:MAG: ABC transporter ATP-binding protein [Ruminococcus sp.]|nr:ABC transporter ATP-binding protein [Ruminococcus sp.]